jgi:NTP pyrophosphatase (non-canonical NTP hydrolase)
MIVVEKKHLVTFTKVLLEESGEHIEAIDKVDSLESATAHRAAAFILSAIANGIERALDR